MGAGLGKPKSPPASPPPPPPIPAVHAARNRPLRDDDGNRIPYTEAEFRRFFATASQRDAVFSNLTLGEALAVSDAFDITAEDGDELRAHDFNMCQDLICENQASNLPLRGHNPPYVHNPEPFEIANTVLTPCPNQAMWTNPTSNVPGFADGVREISYCMEASNRPINGVHHHAGSLICCKPCKDARFMDVWDRKKTLQFGICDDCDAYCLANLNQRFQCGCEPTGYWTDGFNGEQRRDQHLCRAHDQAYYAIIAAAAQAEIDIRRRMRKSKKPKRTQYATKVSKAAPRDTLTPAQWRQRHKWATATGPMRNVPRCFCGNVMTAAKHTRTPVPSVEGRFHWRNCVGCNEYVMSS